jgi:hypothetical protein
MSGPPKPPRREPGSIIERLEDGRAAADSGFRVSLKARLLSELEAETSMRAPYRAAGYTGAGVVVLFIAVLGIIGVGPLAAG